MSITFEASGEFEDTERWLKKMSNSDIFNVLERYGSQGVAALSAATPTRTGATAASWSYEVKKTPGTWSIIWNNSNIVSGVPIAVIIQVGHGTGTGGYVAGRDYINPALRPIFDQMATEAWNEVNRG
jgi:hypothetical protein